MKVIMTSGRELEVHLVIKGGMMDYLHIYVNTLSITEIYDIFSNPEETAVITVIRTDEQGAEIRNVYRGYTELYSVQKPFLKSPEGTKMVWLNRPTEILS